MNFQNQQLLEAVETGNLSRVKQLITSGIDVNSMLLCQNRRNVATVLGTAAFDGHIHIMEYLLQEKAQVNYKDPILNRNALHVACMGAHTEAVKFLLRKGCNVDDADRNGVTPLHKAAMIGDSETLKILLRHGASVNQLDRLRSSALHYASFSGSSEAVRVLIQSGCVHNNMSIFGKGTPLANLVYAEDFVNCILLIEAGYQLDNDKWILSYDFKTSEKAIRDVVLYLSQMMTEPHPMQLLCRRTVIKQLGDRNISDKIEKLPVPKLMKRYLRLCVTLDD